MSSNTKTISYKKVLELHTCVKELDSNKKDRLSVEIVDFHDVLEPHRVTFFKKERKINQELSSLDKDGNFFTDELGQPVFTKFTKEAQVKKDFKLEELLKEEVTIEVNPIGDLTRVKSFHLSVIRLFNGFLFNISKQELEELYSGKLEKGVIDKNK